MPDHVHLLLALSPTIAVATLGKEIKGASGETRRCAGCGGSIHSTASQFGSYLNRARMSSSFHKPEKSC